MLRSHLRQSAFALSSEMTHTPAPRSVESELTAPAGSRLCLPFVDLTFDNTGYEEILTDFLFGHAPVLDGAAYGGYETYYDALFTGFTFDYTSYGYGTYGYRTAIADDGEDSEGTFVLTSDHIDWTWVREEVTEEEMEESEARYDTCDSYSYDDGVVG